MASTAEKKGKVPKEQSVLSKYLHGASLADGLIAKMKKSSGGKKKGKAKKRLRYPPTTGWTGGSPDANKGFSGPQR